MIAAGANGYTSGTIPVQSPWTAQAAYLVAKPTSWYSSGRESKRFNLNAPPQVFITEPVGTSQYSAGDTVDIQWKASGCVDVFSPI